MFKIENLTNGKCLEQFLSPQILNDTYTIVDRGTCTLIWVTPPSGDGYGYVCTFYPDFPTPSIDFNLPEGTSREQAMKFASAPMSALALRPDLLEFDPENHFFCHGCGEDMSASTVSAWHDGEPYCKTCEETPADED